MIGTKLRFMLGATALAMLAGCGDVDTEGSAYGMLAAAVKQTVSQQKRDETTAKVDPSQMAATALRVNKGPLILAGLERMNTTQVLAMTGENAGQRTYMTENQQALILRDGMLAGTRGLGHDLSVAEMAQSSALIRANRSGKAQRIMRYWTGDGLERPLRLDCTIAPAAKPGVMQETCVNGPLKVENSYITQDGRVTVSRQWIGPDLGYVTIQELRP